VQAREGSPHPHKSLLQPAAAALEDQQPQHSHAAAPHCPLTAAPQKSAASGGHCVYMSSICALWQKRSASMAHSKATRKRPSRARKSSWRKG
jgi:hypothetical protein